MKKALYLVVALVLLAAMLTACGGGGGSSDPNCGVYEASTAEMMGITMDIADLFEGGCSIELLDGGKAKFNYDGKSYNMKWTLEGSTFHAEGGGAELDGTLSGGVMELTDLLGSGLNMTLVNGSYSGGGGESSQPAKSSDLVFFNDLNTEIHNVYISDVTSDVWGDPVTEGRISSGSTYELSFDSFDAAPGVFDVGAIDENAMNYDAEALDLAVGDKITLRGNSDGAVYIVTHADGSEDTYDCFIYPND